MYEWGWATASGGLIMVVDDDPVLVMLVSKRLQKEGFRVVSAPDVARAVRNTGRVNPRLILLDMNLPDGTGMDVLRQIKATLPGQIPVIAMSATEDPLMGDRMIAAGAAAFLRKPIDFDELWRTMDVMLEDNVLAAACAGHSASG